MRIENQNLRIAKVYVYAGTFLLATSLACGGCGGRSESVSTQTMCRAPDSFPTADGGASDCRIVDVAACDTTEGAVVLCPGKDARDCGSSLVALNARCVSACSAIAYALECSGPAPTFGHPQGAPDGCISLDTPPSGPSLACCPCLAQ